MAKKKPNKQKKNVSSSPVAAEPVESAIKETEIGVNEENVNAEVSDIVKLEDGLSDAGAVEGQKTEDFAVEKKMEDASPNITDEVAPDPNVMDPTIETNGENDTKMSTPDIVESAAPVLKKRLTLQERLALAAGKTKKKSSKRTVSEATSTTAQFSSPSPRSSLDSSRPSIEIKDPSSLSTEVTINKKSVVSIEEPQKLIPINVSELAQEELLKLIVEVENKFKILENTNKSLVEENNSLHVKVKNLQYLSVQQSSSSSLSVAEHLLKEKEEKIVQLLKEGEELSHKELKHTTLIKKLKSKESEYDSIIKNLEEELKDQKVEINQFNESLKLVQNSEKILIQQQKSLELKTSNHETLLKEQTELRKSLEKEKIQLNKEIISLQKQLDQEKDKTVLQKQEYYKETLRLEAKIEELRFQSENNQAGSIQTNSSSSNDEAYLKLVKQHDLLQNQYTSATENWQSIEASLEGKLNNLEYEKEELISIRDNQVSKIDILTNDLKIKTNEIDELVIKVKDLDIEKYKFETKIESLSESLKDSEDLLQEKEVKFIQEQKSLEFKITELTKKLKTAATSTTASLVSTVVQPQMLNITENYLAAQQQTSAPFTRPSSFRKNWDNRSDIHFGESSTTPYQSRKSSAIFNSNYPERSFNSSIDDEYDEDDLLDANSLSISRQQTQRRESNSGSITVGGSSVQLLSKMSGQVRRLEMELATMKEELVKFQDDKKLLNEEIVKLMKDNEQIDSYKTKIESLEVELKRINKSYEGTLIILGEKTERVNELMADVEDLKDLCKLQVQQLVEIQNR